MKIPILDRQSIFDLALQSYGSIEAVFTLAETNGLKLTEDLTAGQTVDCVIEKPLDRNVATYYANRSVTPATALASELTSGDGAILLEGIEHWGIEYDFFVS